MKNANNCENQFLATQLQSGCVSWNTSLTLRIDREINLKYM